MDAPATPPWHVYLVRCIDGSLYTGVAVDVRRRLQEHRRSEGRGAKFLRGRGPLRLVFSAAVGDRSLALRVESRIKQLTKARKEALVKRKVSIEEIVARITGDR